jgi:t-SNARE complex subunit (syntaxin)
MVPSVLAKIKSCLKTEMAHTLLVPVEDIERVCRDVQQINEIFTDLSHLTKQQGEMIDNIEIECRKASEHVQKGREELRKASESQKRYRKNLCSIVATVLGTAAVVTGVSVGVHALKK